MKNKRLDAELIRHQRINRSLALGVADSIGFVTPASKPRKHNHYGLLVTSMLCILALGLLALSEVIKHA